jgi:hypothetical protein
MNTTLSDNIRSEIKRKQRFLMTLDRDCLSLRKRTLDEIEELRKDLVETINMGKNILI